MHRNLETDRRPPYVPGDYRYVRAGREGTYWQSADGLVVRVAAAEPGRARGARSPVVWHVPLVALFGGAWQR